MNDSQFYTYLWLREDGTPYYVGKGSGKRAIRKGSPTNLNCILIQEHESESDAFTAEVFLIAYYGRKDLSTGLLRNRTNGGEGAAGHIYSENSKQLMSNAQRQLWADDAHKQRMICSHIGQRHMGHKVTPDGRKNMGKSHNGEPSRHARWHVNRGIVREGCLLCSLQ